MIESRVTESQHGVKMAESVVMVKSLPFVIQSLGFGSVGIWVSWELVARDSVIPSCHVASYWQSSKLKQ